METVQYNGRTYELVKNDTPKVPYLLKGPRGALYGLMRNVQEPECLFPVNGRTGRVLDGWFSDKGGQLRQISNY